MKIKLYKLNIYTSEKKLDPLDFEIEGKLISYFEPPNDPSSDFFHDGIFEERFFNYEYDNSYKYKFKNLKLNHRFRIHPFHENDDATISGFVGYGHLSLIMRLKLDWIFRKTWFQKPENIKWLISIPIAILTAWLTSIFTK